MGLRTGFGTRYFDGLLQEGVQDEESRSMMTFTSSGVINVDTDLNMTTGTELDAPVINDRLGDLMIDAATRDFYGVDGNNIAFSLDNSGNISAKNDLSVTTLTDGAGVSHSGELADLADVPDVSDGGSLIVSSVGDINFASNLSVTDDGDGSVTVDASGGGTTKNAASLTSTDTSTDINKTSWTQIPWNNQLDVDAGYTHDPANSPAQITFDNAGTYKVHVSISFDAVDNYRVNPGIRFAINGTRRDRTGLTGYNRDASGHHEASNVLTEQITVNAGDTLTVQTYQFGNSGTCTMRSGESVLLIEEISETTALSGDADTVDGKHAADLQTSPGEVTSSNWGDYEIQKNGTDGTNIINFKT